LGRYAEAREILLSTPPETLARLEARLWLAVCELRLSGAPELPEVCPPLTDQEARAVFELATALDEALRVEDALRYYEVFLETGHHDGAFHDKDCGATAEIRRKVMAEVLALRRKESVSVSFAALQLEIFRLLVIPAPTEAEAHEAARLCELLPAHDAARIRTVTDCLMTAAALLERLGLSSTAIRLYRRVVSLDLADRAALDNAGMRLGLLLHHAGNQEEALPVLRHALSPGVSPAVLTGGALALLEILASLQCWGEARELVHRILAEARPDDAQRVLFWELLDIRYRAHLGEIQEFDEEAIGILPAERPQGPDLASAWMSAGLYLEVSGYLPQSRVFYEILLEANCLPTGMRTDLHYRLGIVLDRLLAFDEAERHLLAAVNSDDPFPAAQAEARLRLANLRFLMDDFAAVLPDFEELRRTASSGYVRAESQFKYAICLLRLGRLQKAHAEFVRCREVGLADGTEFEVKADLMLAEMAEQSQNWSEAAICYERIIHNPISEALTKAAALTRLHSLRRKRR